MNLPTNQTEQKRVLNALRSLPDELVVWFEEQLRDLDAGLRKAPITLVPQLQGQAQVLAELLDFRKTAQKQPN